MKSIILPVCSRKVPRNVCRLYVRLSQKLWFALFLKKGVLKYFYKFHRKTPVLVFLLNKNRGLQTSNFIKKRLQHRYFSKFAKFLITRFFTENLLWLLFPSVSSFSLNPYIVIFLIFYIQLVIFKSQKLL